MVSINAAQSCCSSSCGFVPPLVLMGAGTGDPQAASNLFWRNYCRNLNERACDECKDVRYARSRGWSCKNCDLIILENVSGSSLLYRVKESHFFVKKVGNKWIKLHRMYCPVILFHETHLTLHRHLFCYSTIPNTLIHSHFTHNIKYIVHKITLSSDFWRLRCGRSVRLPSRQHFVP